MVDVPSLYDKQRIVLNVSPSPDAPFDEQYVDYPSKPVAPVPVDLYVATGRVDIGP